MIAEENSIAVFACGATVKVHGCIDGIITAISIRNSSISYEVTFVNGGTTEAKYYYDYELSVQPIQYINIGFINKSFSNKGI